VTAPPLAALYADRLAGLPDSLNGQPPLRVPTSCPVTLNELVGAQTAAPTDPARHQCEVMKVPVYGVSACSPLAA
jgi:hypothetical protein